MNTIAKLTNKYINKNIPDFSSGDTVSVEVTVKEGNKTRLQKYEGVVISRHGKKGMDASFTVRKISNGVGVERIFPLHSPALSLIEVKRQGKVRRAKLNYLKNVVGVKAARIKEKKVEKKVCILIVRPLCNYQQRRFYENIRGMA